MVALSMRHDFSFLGGILRWAGIVALLAMPQELNPNVNFGWAFVTIPYPGASPSEVEDLIVIPVEEELDKLDHVSEILSTDGRVRTFRMGVPAEGGAGVTVVDLGGTR